MTTIDDLYEKLDRIENKLNALEPTINTIEKLQESGIIGMIDGFAEDFDNIFNYSTKMEILDTVTLAIRVLKPLSKVMKKGDIEKLLLLLENVDFNKLIPLLEALASCAPEARDVLKVSSRRKEKMGLMEMMNQIRSPEMAALIAVARKLSGCMLENIDKDKK
ncbi:MAG: hypothetical protein QXT54_04890, partial [Thermoplasmatales archaeon]